MSEDPRATGTSDGEPVAGRTAGYLRYVPAVVFGLRAAVLAGLVISAGISAARLGIGGEPSGAEALGWPWPQGSTCCPEQQ